MTIAEIPPRTRRSFELSGDYWFNSEPVPITALHGKIILLHFWEFSSIASLRSLPYVEEWSRRYAPHGLIVVGVHIPRYDFSSRPEEVMKAIARSGVACPVVCDNQHQVASRYDVRSTPSTILLDQEGFVRYHCSGDGDAMSIEHAIRSLLHGLSPGEPLPLPALPLREEDMRGAVRYRATPELHAGYLHRDTGNDGQQIPESLGDYADPGIYIDGRIYVDGSWYCGRDFLRTAEGNAGRLLVRYHAMEAHAVLSPNRASGVEVTVSQDGRFLTPENKGEDVEIDEHRRSFLRVANPRSYNLVRNPDPHDHSLCLTFSGSQAVSFYTFAFVAGVIPETIPGG